MTSFVERHNLWSADQHKRADEIADYIAHGPVDVVRFMWPDQHGVLRGKTLVAAAACEALREGVNLTSTLLAKDTACRTVFPVFATGGAPHNPSQGAGDFRIVPDPSSFHMLPWSPRSGWLLCDAYTLDGQPNPFGARRILQRAVGELDAQGLEFVAGLEVEFHVFKLDDPSLQLEHSSQPGEPPRVSLLTHGHQYLSELRYDRAEPLMELLRAQLLHLGLPLLSLEVEFGPTQFELVFGPTAGVAPADTMVLLRSAIKQICHRHGYHATFMCRPRIPNVMSSGWHLHQSLRAKADGRNVFVPDGDESPLSPLGLHYLAGLKAHARGAAPFASPTINGYRRYRPLSLAPDRASWARDNRGAMLRVMGGLGQSASRVENRVGEPNANPYLHVASQVFSGLDGIRRKLSPGPSADTPYDTPAVPLPRSLEEALQALRQDAYLCEQYTQRFVDYFCFLKEAELARFHQAVTEWEQREYFDMF
jgi:glutamine synthetase